MKADDPTVKQFSESTTCEIGGLSTIHTSDSICPEAVEGGAVKTKFNLYTEITKIRCNITFVVKNPSPIEIQNALVNIINMPNQKEQNEKEEKKDDELESEHAELDPVTVETLMKHKSCCNIKLTPPKTLPKISAFGSESQPVSTEMRVNGIMGADWPLTTFVLEMAGKEGENNANVTQVKVLNNNFDKITAYCEGGDEFKTLCACTLDAGLPQKLIYESIRKDFPKALQDLVQNFAMLAESLTCINMEGM